MKTFAILLTLFFLCADVIGQSSNSIRRINPGMNGYKPGEVLIKFKDNITVDLSLINGKLETGILRIDSLLSAFSFSTGIKVFSSEESTGLNKQSRSQGSISVDIPKLFNIYRFAAPDSIAIEPFISAVESDPSIDFAEPNYFVYSLGSPVTIPNDPLYTQQPWLVTINAPAVWDSTTGDTTQVIAIIDTGIDWTHPDLVSNIWRNWDEIPGNGIDDDQNGFVDDVRGWDFINHENNPADDNSHGTHVAGIAAAKGNNGIGITGVAWNAKIMPIKMLQSSGSGTVTDLAAAIAYASNNGASVINMSLGYYTESQTVKIALENAYATSVLVAAAGNDEYCICDDCNLCFTMFPAAYPFVIGVMANGPGTGFSNYDPSGPTIFTNGGQYNYEIAAPGGNILSTLPNGSYGYYSGTSMAAPMVSGAVALMKSYDPLQSTETLFCRMIQGAAGGTLNIYNSLNPSLLPSLIPLNVTMHDTLPGCNNNYIANSGERINYTLTVQNSGGWADSVYVIMKLKNPADTLYAKITDSLSYLGDISSYGSIISNDALIISIDSATPHNTRIDIRFLISAKNSCSIVIDDTIKVYRSDLLWGYLDSTLVLTPDKRWIVYPWLSLTPGGKLILKPGTELDLTYSGIYLGNNQFEALGTRDSMINIYGTGTMIHAGNAIVAHTKMIGARFQNMNNAEFTNCEFYDMSLPFTSGQFKFNDCLFYNVGFGGIGGSGPLRRCNFVKCSGYIVGWWMANPALYYCNFSQIERVSQAYIFHNYAPGFIGNNFLTGPGQPVFSGDFPGDVYTVPPQYWGTTDTAKIDEKIIDFWENPGFCIVRYQPILTKPSDSAHGIVWKVEINGVDPQDEPYDPLGSGLARFDVYFNRPMDISYLPLLSFSAWEPYTHRIVKDSASWNADSTVWTAYYNITKETGDGINVIKVSGARDNLGWDIPPEFNNRFQFVIQAASSASIDFTATPGINHVDLEWPPAGTPDAMGYNLYRFGKNGVTLVSDTVRVNESLITDTTYTDTNMALGPTYYYFYRILSTDLKESYRSKFAEAVPYPAPEGDANGDLNINILDITALVSYILGNNPSPFVFYAADVNDDNKADILDLIGIINIILDKFKDVSAGSIIGPLKAAICIDNNKVLLKSPGGVSTLYFEFVGAGNGQVILIPCMPGFEMAYSCADDDRLRIVLYSLENRTIPPGIQPLFTIEGTTSLRLADAFGGDTFGRYILINNDSLLYLNEDDVILQAYPNPFTRSVTITWYLPVPSWVEISICNHLGQKIDGYTAEGLEMGNHSYELKSGNAKDGVYYCVLKVKTQGGKFISRTIKLISIRK